MKSKYKFGKWLASAGLIGGSMILTASAADPDTLTTVELQNWVSLGLLPALLIGLAIYSWRLHRKIVCLLPDKKTGKEISENLNQLAGKLRFPEKDLEAAFDNVKAAQINEDVITGALRKTLVEHGINATAMSVIRRNLCPDRNDGENSDDLRKMLQGLPQAIHEKLKQGGSGGFSSDLLKLLRDNKPFTAELNALGIEKDGISAFKRNFNLTNDRTKDLPTLLGSISNQISSLTDGANGVSKTAIAELNANLKAINQQQSALAAIPENLNQLAASQQKYESSRIQLVGIIDDRQRRLEDEKTEFKGKLDRLAGMTEQCLALQNQLNQISGHFQTETQSTRGEMSKTCVNLERATQSLLAHARELETEFSRVQSEGQAAQRKAEEANRAILEAGGKLRLAEEMQLGAEKELSGIASDRAELAARRDELEKLVSRREALLEDEQQSAKRRLEAIGALTLQCEGMQQQLLQISSRFHADTQNAGQELVNTRGQLENSILGLLTQTDLLRQETLKVQAESQAARQKIQQAELAILEADEKLCQAERKLHELEQEKTQLNDNLAALETQKTEFRDTLKLTDCFWPESFKAGKPLERDRRQIEEESAGMNVEAGMLLAALFRYNLHLSARNSEETPTMLVEVARRAYGFWQSQELTGDQVFEKAQCWMEAFNDELKGRLTLRIARPGIPKDGSWMSYAEGGPVRKIETWAVFSGAVPLKKAEVS